MPRRPLLAAAVLAAVVAVPGAPAGAAPRHTIDHRLDRASLDLVRVRTLLDRAGSPEERARLLTIQHRIETRKVGLVSVRIQRDRAAAKQARRTLRRARGERARKAAVTPASPSFTPAALPSVVWGAPLGGIGTMAYPVAAPATMIGTPYAGTHRLGNWQSDNAVDLAVPVGTQAVAVSDGVIGGRIGPLSAGGGRFAGLRLTLETPANAFYYAHLSALFVTAGQYVRRGQVIGLTGSANGVEHLHLGMRSGDPVAAFGAATTR